jgi:uncharacterized protein YbjQ (UPF0145 family)
MDAKLEKRISRFGPPDRAFECTIRGKAAAAAFTPTTLVVASTSLVRDAWDAEYRFVMNAELRDHTCRVQVFGVTTDLEFPDAGQAASFHAELQRRRPAERRRPARVDPVPAQRVTTLPALPGYRIVRVVGAITELSATSGFTATSKGTSALDNAMRSLRLTAAESGANAIVGLAGSAFGAAGGITSAFGGDAVGVLLIGTAVVVEADDQPRPPALGEH